MFPRLAVTCTCLVVYEVMSNNEIMVIWVEIIMHNHRHLQQIVVVGQIHIFVEWMMDDTLIINAINMNHAQVDIDSFCSWIFWCRLSHQHGFPGLLNSRSRLGLIHPVKYWLCIITRTPIFFDIYHNTYFDIIWNSKHGCIINSELLLKYAEDDAWDRTIIWMEGATNAFVHLFRQIAMPLVAATPTADPSTDIPTTNGSVGKTARCVGIILSRVG